MPKDAWKRANNRARYGPTATKQHRRPAGSTDPVEPVIRSRRQRKARRKKQRLARSGGPGAWSASTVLWFGKHKGKPVGEIPIDYLQWLAQQSPSSPNVAALAAWLRSEYILTLETAVTPTTSA